MTRRAAMTGGILPGSRILTFRHLFTRVALSALCLGLLGACDNDRTAAEYVKNAETQYEAGKLRAAVIELKNALRQDSSSAPTRLRLGQIYLELGDGQAAEIELRLARNNGADPAVVIPYQAEAWILQSKSAPALEVLTTEGVTEPVQLARRLTLRGHSEVIAGNAGAAEHEYELALKNKPDYIPALVGAARLAMGRADIARTKELTDYAETLAPNDPEWLALAGDVAFLHGELDMSEVAYRKIINRKREDVRTLSAYLGLGRTYIAQGKLKEAADAINVVLAQTPREPTSNYLRALAAYQAKDYVTARNYVRTTLGSAPDFGPAHLLSGAVAYALGENETAHK